MSYRVPAEGVHQAEIEIKKSRFIACAQQVSDRSQAMAFLQDIKQQYPLARHYCWAYLLGDPHAASSAAMNDDGEPGGTAGKPILNVIQHKKIGDLMVIVVRYFGGVKLGAGGLTRAYSSATEALLSTLPTIGYVAMEQRSVTLGFEQEHALRHWLDGNQGCIVAIDYTEVVTAQIEFPAHSKATLDAFLNALSFTK